MKIKAVAFDIDGTLYPNSSFFSKVWFYYLIHIRFFRKYNKVRKLLRNSDNLVKTTDFFEKQAQLFAETAHCTVEKAREKIQKIVYDGLVPYYAATKTFKDVDEAFRMLKANNIKIAILSDFPVEQKGELWGLKPMCDVLFGSEKIGVLKPSPVCFEELAKALGEKPEDILYVGNSFEYDVLGSKNAGYKSAWITKKVKKNQTNVADMEFSTYRQFIDNVLQ